MFFKTEKLNAFYGATQVLWDIDITVGVNEVVSLIGANGAGKTTLMHTISGIADIRRGSIKFQGEELIGMDAANIVMRGIAHAPEGRRLFPGMSVMDNLLMGAYIRKDDKATIKRDLDRVFEFFPRLAERKKQLTGKMSGGEQQMCAIGRALMSNPKLLLIDELSWGLAPVVIDELLIIIRRLRDEGMSILLVEQDVQTGLDVSERAYVLERGEVVLSGSSEELKDNPQIKESYLGI